MRKIYDISLTISPDIPVWPGNPPVELERVEKIEEGAEANLSRLNTIVHCGTHVDAPYHFLADGERVDHLSLEAMIGPAWVVQIPLEVERITRPVLEKVLPAERIERLLFRTRDSQQWQQGATSFRKDFAFAVTYRQIEMLNPTGEDTGRFRIHREVHPTVFKTP